MKKKIVNMILSVLVFLASVDMEKTDKNILYFLVLLVSIFQEMFIK